MSPGGTAELVRVVLDRRGRVRLPVSGTSMVPTLVPGGAVTVHAVPFSSVRPGAVIAFRCNDDIVVHRVLHRTRDALLAAGDNLPLFDPPVAEEAFLGIVAGTPPAPARSVDWPATATSVNHLWIAGHPHREVRPPAGWEVHHVPRQAGAPKVVAGQAPIVAISPYGVVDGRRSALPVPAGVHVLIGWRFGDRHPLLPPDTAQVHLRLGRPGEELGVKRTTDRFLHLLTGRVAA